MKATKRNFIINELMVKDFAEWSAGKIHLEETEEEGKSELDFQVVSDENLIIKNVDKKHTELMFFQNSGTKFMLKRVDHIVFEHISDNDWKLHLIEMKSNIFDKKYTTYENVHFSKPDTMPSARRLPLGVPQIKPQEEWDHGKVGINFGKEMKFSHVPIQMKRNEEDILVGEHITFGG